MTHDTTTASLAQWLQAAWARHDREPLALAGELQAAAPDWPDSADGAEALRLATHVLLGHLHDTEALERLLAQLPAGAAFTPGRAQARWSLAVVRGEAPPDTPMAERWRGLHDAALAMAMRGDAPRALTLLQTHDAEARQAAAQATVDTAALRAQAAAANNIAAGLRSWPQRDEGAQALMLEAAAKALAAWTRAGTWLHIERAHYQCARCLALAGDGEAAQAHAQACLDICEREGADAFERFFAHEAWAWAAHARGDGEALSRQRSRMQALREAVTADLHSWCDDALRELP